MRLPLVVALALVLLGCRGPTGDPTPRAPAPTMAADPRATPRDFFASPALLAAGPPSPSPSPACTFGSRFAELAAELGPGVVGDCVQGERDDATARVRRQRTTRGELVWFRDSGTVAFTDGATTWYRCPGGLEQRPSGQPAPC